MLVAPAFSVFDPSSDIKKKKINKIRGLLPIKCFRQVYASACSAHNVGDSELSPMEDLC